MARGVAKLAVRAARRAQEQSRKKCFRSPRRERDSMSRLAKCIGIGLLLFAISCSSAAATGWQHIGNVQRVEKLPDGVELTAGSAKVRITAFRDGVIRVRLAPQGSFPKDFSWAIVESPDLPAFSVD